MECWATYPRRRFLDAFARRQDAGSCLHPVGGVHCVVRVPIALASHWAENGPGAFAFELPFRRRPSAPTR
jgi:hypothetical protein